MDRQGTKNQHHIYFVDGQGNDLFQLPDNGAIQLIYGDGSYYIGICRYVDERHFKLDGYFWDLRDFAEHMERSGIIYRQYK